MSSVKGSQPYRRPTGPRGLRGSVTAAKPLLSVSGALAEIACAAADDDVLHGRASAPAVRDDVVEMELSRSCLPPVDLPAAVPADHAVTLKHGPTDTQRDRWPAVLQRARQPLLDQRVQLGGFQSGALRAGAALPRLLRQMVEHDVMPAHPAPSGPVIPGNERGKQQSFPESGWYLHEISVSPLREPWREGSVKLITGTVVRHLPQPPVLGRAGASCLLALFCTIRKTGTQEESTHQQETTG